MFGLCLLYFGLVWTAFHFWCTVLAYFKFVLKVCSVYVWCLFGLCVGVRLVYAWFVLGLNVVRIWTVCGLCLVYVWLMFG